MKQVLLFITGLAAGGFFYQLHVPIPFILAAMLVGLFSSQLPKRLRAPWPMQGRNAGLLVVGYAIGAAVTPEAWQDFVSQIFTIVAATVIIVVVSAVIAYLMAKTMHADLASCILGMMPGGLAMIMVLVEDDRRFDPNIVMVTQVIRLFGVIFSVPLLAVLFFDARVAENVVTAGAADGLPWILFIPLGLCGALFFEKFHLPIPWMLGPATATALCAVFCNQVQGVPCWLMWPAQVAVGLKMGQLMDSKRVWAIKRLVPMIMAGTVILIGVSFLTANFLHCYYGLSLTTAFLAVAPGGISEMSIAGLAMGADVAIILAYQLLRIFSISSFVPYLAQKFH